MISTNRLLFSFLLIAVLFCISCLKVPESPVEIEPEEVPSQNQLDEVFIPEGFAFGMTTEQQLTLIVNDADDNPIAGVLFNIYTAPLAQGGKLLGNGVTNAEGILSTHFEISYGKEALYAYTAFQPLVRSQRLEITGKPIVHVWGSAPEPSEGVAYRFASARANEFNCQTGLYQVIGKSLKKLNVSTGTYITVGTASKNYNGIGYNSEDNFIYGIRKNDSIYNLWRIDNTGIESDLGAISGVGGKGLNYKSDFDLEGNLCIAGSQSGTWKFVTIDVDQSPLTASTQSLTQVGAVYNIHDITYNSIHDKFYAMDMRGHFVEIDREALTVQRIADYSATIGRGAFGALWSDTDGDVFVSQNKTGNIYKVTLDEAGTPTGIQFIMQGESTGNNDGASCVQADDPFRDTDGDGIIDELDAFPEDPTRAYTSYSPSQGSSGTYAFEDKWPKKGDYDFNDLVVDYNYEYLKNAKNEIAKLRLNYTVRIVGATFQLGFGLSFDDLIPSDVLTVTGTEAPSISTDFNGVETFQPNAVVIVFDDIHTLMGFQPGIMINAGKGRVADNYTFSVLVDLANPVADIGTLNPFIFTQGSRSLEVHMKGYNPTAKADLGYFRTEDDASSGANTYQTANGMPWAMNFPSSFSPPKEFTSLERAYPQFPTWVSSNGLSQTDWYSRSKARLDSLIIREIPEEGE